VNDDFAHSSAGNLSQNPQKSMIATYILFLINYRATNNEHTGQLLLAGPNSLWWPATKPKFWIGHGPSVPPCSAQCS